MCDLHLLLCLNHDSRILGLGGLEYKGVMNMRRWVGTLRYKKLTIIILLFLKNLPLL